MSTEADDVQAVEELGKARDAIVAELRKVIVGMDDVIDEMMIAIFARGHCLRLVAVPEAGADPPRVVHQSPVSVISPSIPVRAGQVVHISGILRIPVPTTANLDGVTLYDTLGGASAALRWHGPQGWQRFELIRDVDRDREFVVRITLNGLGEVKVDDLRVVAFDPPGPVNSSTSAGNRPRSGESRRSALDFLPRLPKLRPLQPRN